MIWSLFRFSHCLFQLILCVNILEHFLLNSKQSLCFASLLYLQSWFEVETIIFLTNLVNKFVEFVVLLYCFFSSFHDAIVQKLIFVCFVSEIDLYFGDQILSLLQRVNVQLIILIRYLRRRAILSTENPQNRDIHSL